MSYYSILAVTPTKQDWIPGYIGPANTLVAKHGGKYLARTANHEQIEGSAQPAALRIIIEWPSKGGGESLHGGSRLRTASGGAHGRVRKLPLPCRSEG